VTRAHAPFVPGAALPEDIMARPGFSEHVAKAAAGRAAFEIPGPSPG
jgi:hypothetical protein